MTEIRTHRAEPGSRPYWPAQIEKKNTAHVSLEWSWIVLTKQELAECIGRDPRVKDPRTHQMRVQTAAGDEVLYVFWWVAQTAFNGFFLLVCCMCHAKHTHSAHVFSRSCDVNTRKLQPHKTSLAVHQDIWFRDDRTITGQPLAICFACSQLLSRTNILHARPHSASAHEHANTAHDQNCTVGYQTCRRHNGVKIYKSYV